MSSLDPLRATFSYTWPDLAGRLRGPFCVECMNELYASYVSHFYSEIPAECGLPILLHTTEGDKEYKINELVYSNGSQRPFLFRGLPNNVELLPGNCTNGCQKQKDESIPHTTNQPAPRLGIATAARVPALVPASTANVIASHSNNHVPENALNPSTSSGSGTLTSAQSSTQNDTNLPLEAITHISDFPFFKSQKPEDCSDALTVDQARAELKNWRRDVNSNLLMTICEVIDSPSLPPDQCYYCHKKLGSGTVLIRHSLSRGHVEKVYDVGNVFSRSKDLEVLICFFRRAKELLAARDIKLNSQLSLVSEANLPMLRGYRREVCTDAATGDELDSLVSLCRPSVLELRSYVNKLVGFGTTDSPLQCWHCEKKFFSSGNCLHHTISERHLDQAEDEGFVFSRSRDYQGLLAIIEAAERLRSGNTIEKRRNVSACVANPAIQEQLQ